MLLIAQKEKTFASPFIRWAGSKRAVLSRLKPYVNLKDGKYIEPFAGSAALFFGIRPKSAVISDLNKELIDTYTEVRRSPEAVSQYLSALPNTQGDFYRIRRIPPNSLLPVQRAARFIYLNRFCFNGLYRTNKSGEFNVPYGRPKNDNRPTFEQLEQCSKVLKGATLECGDFDSIVRQYAQAGDFVYLDPPYALTERRVFREYGDKPFSSVDLERLKALLSHIDRIGATFVMSYAFNNDLSKRFSEWKCSRIAVQRNIAGFSSFRRKSIELVVSNHPSPEGHFK